MPPETGVTASRRSLEVWNVWTLMLTLALSVLVVTPFLAVPVLATKAFALGIGAIATLVFFIVTRLSRGNIVFPPLMLVGALWLPVIAYALSSAFSGVPFVSALWGSALETDTLGFMLVAAALGTLTALVLRRADQYRTFLSGAAWVYVAVVVAQVVTVVVGQLSPTTVSPSFSLLGSFEDLAYVLGLGLIGTLVTLRFVEVAQRTRRVLSLAAVGALFLLAIANSTFVWIMLTLVALGLFIEAAMMRKHTIDDADLAEVALVSEDTLESDTGNHSVALSLPVLAVAVFFLVGGTLSGALANALHVNVLSVSPSWQSTFDVARKTYAVSPVFGTGPGTFGVEWLKYRDPSLNATVFWNTDFTAGIGFIPTSLVTTGLLGAAAWLLFIGFLLVVGVRTLVVRTPSDPYARYVSILAFVASVYLFATAIFTVPSAVVVALAFVFAGLFASTVRFAAASRQRGIVFSRSPRLGFVVVFALTLLMFVSVVVAYSVVERYVAAAVLTSANAAFTKGDLAKADAVVQSSISFAPSSAAYQAQADIAVVRLRQIAASTTMPAAAAQQAFQATLSAGINAALTATRLAPNNYQNWLALGNLYAQAVPLNVAGAYDSAKTAYQKAIDLNPTSHEIHYVLAQLDIAHKDTKAAVTELKSAIALKQDYLDAIYLLSQLQVQDGNVKEALDAALAAAYFAPNDPNVLFQVGVLEAASGDYVSSAKALSAAVAANNQFANARYFLAAVYAKQKDFVSAVAELQAIGGLSPDNAKIIDPLVVQLQAGKNPFPANLLTIAPPATN